MIIIIDVNFFIFYFIIIYPDCMIIISMKIIKERYFYLRRNTFFELFSMSVKH